MGKYLYLSFHEQIVALVCQCILFAYRFLAVRQHVSFPETRETAHAKLLKSIQGCTVEIRDVDNTYNGWPRGLSPHLHALRRAADDKLESTVANKLKLQKLKQADFALSVAMWWPYGTLEDLTVILYLIIWLFTWDDDVDESGGSVFDDFAAAQNFRQETVDYVTHCLGFESLQPYKQPTNPLILNFCVIDQRQRFLREVTYYIEMCEAEQRLRMHDKVPSIKEFWQIRMGASAVNLTTSMVELARQSTLPQQVLEDADMTRIWKETNVIISASNDMLSLKKEIAHDQVINLIPLLCSGRGLHPQSAMDAAASEVEVAVKRFERAAERLESRYPGNTANGRHVREFVEGCQYTVTGNHNFSLVTPRYGLASAWKGDSLVFSL